MGGAAGDCGGEGVERILGRTVRESFADPNQLFSDFYRDVGYSALFIFIMVLLVWLADRESRGKIFAFSFGVYLFIGFVVFGLLVLDAYSNTIGRFSSFVVEQEIVTFYYPGDRTIRAPSGDIAHVLFGYDGKSVTGLIPCYLGFELKNGEHYLSAPRRETLESCNALRLMVLKALMTQ